MSSYERDRFGQRPLYYAARDGRLHVAERVDTLLCEASLPRALDADAAALALCDALPAGASLSAASSGSPRVTWCERARQLR